MKKKGKIILCVIIVLLIFTVVTGGIIMKNNHDNKVLEEQITAEQLSQAYYNQNVAFRLYTDDQYHAMPEYPGSEDGINSDRYFDFACYKKLTGNDLTYEQAREYLSEQYEEDGEVRIYNNGRHSEIKQYIEWALGHERERESYIMSIVQIYNEYLLDYGITQFIDSDILYRNQAILDELIKKEADPNYLMDEEIMWGGLDFGPLAESAQ